MEEQLTYSRMKIEDRERVLDFLRVAYPDTPRQSDPEFWTWHYVDHPNARPGEIPVWLAKSGDRIVGQLATIPVELNLGTHTVPASWLTDLIVDEGFRRRGIAETLVKCLQSEQPFVLATPTDKQNSRELFRKLGWTTVGKLPRLHMILFPGSALREVASIGPVRSVIDTLYGPFRPQRGTLRGNPNIRTLNQVDRSFDELWSGCRGQWGSSISRSSEYLRWQFEQQPGKKFDLIGYVEDGRLCGYAVMFFRRASAGGVIEKAAISDICYQAHNAEPVVDALISATLDLAMERRAGGLVTDVIDPLVEKLLRKKGFRRVKSGIEIMAFGPHHHEQLYNADAWHLTRGDSDISIFEEPNLEE